MRALLAFAAGLAALMSLHVTHAQAPIAKSPGPAHAEFIRGVAWLHSFMYEDAIDAFRAAQKIDPNSVMAYWGEAMSFSQPLWFFEEIDKGRAALAKLGATPAARMAKARTRRGSALRPGRQARASRSAREGNGEGRG